MLLHLRKRNPGGCRIQYLAKFGFLLAKKLIGPLVGQDGTGGPSYEDTEVCCTCQVLLETPSSVIIRPVRSYYGQRNLGGSASRELAVT